MKSKAHKSPVGQQAKSILKILVNAAPRPDRSITYGELSKQTGIANCALRAPMDRLSDALAEYCNETGKHVPPIQVIIVNSKTGVPGPGRHIGEPYLIGKEYGEISLEEQMKVVGSIRAAIADFKEWKAIEQELGVRLSA